MGRYFFLFILLWPKLALNQVIKHRQYTAQDGLAGSTVYRIIKDNAGYIWLSTNNGISRFDGSSFTNYYINQFKEQMIALDSDPDGRIWIAGERNIFYIKNGELSRYPMFTKLPSHITNIYFVKGKIWIMNKYNEVGFVKDNRYSPLILTSEKNDTIKINDIKKTADNSLLLATESGIYIVDANSVNPNYLTPKLSDAFYAIYVDKISNAYFAANKYIVKYDCKSRTVTKLNIHTALPILHFAIDSTNIWYSTATPGFELYNGTNTKDIAKNLGLQQIFINDIFINGSIAFIATYGKGLFVINRTDFVRYDALPIVNAGNVSVLKELNDGNIYIGSYGGLVKITNDRFVYLSQIKLRLGERINDIYYDNSALWVTTPYNTYKLNADGTTSKSTGGLKIVLDTDSNILVPSYQEILKFSRNSKIITYLENWPTRFATGKRTNDIVIDKFGKKWVATYPGVTELAESKNWILKSNEPLLNAVNDLELDDEGNVWCAAEGGLIRISPEKTVRIYTTKDGLSDDCCVTVHYKRGTLWIGTCRGLTSYNKNRSVPFIVESKIPPEEVTGILNDKSNKLWVATGEGLYQWDLSKDFEDEKPNSITIQSYNLKQSDIVNDTTIVIQDNNNNLDIYFTSIEYSRPQDLVFEFRLLGADSSWKSTRERSIHLAALKPNLYHLELRTRYNGSSLTSNIKRISITVLPPFWQKTWFIITAALGLVVIFLSALSWRIQLVRKKEKVKSKERMQLLTLKQQAMNALINPHFIFNSLNSIQHFINQSDAHTANKYLSRFAKLIRTAMEQSTKNEISLREEINSLDSYLSLETLRLRNKLSYTITVSSKLNIDLIFIPAMLIQPYVENAVWHGISPMKENGEIQINFDNWTEQSIRVTISDNGVGYQKDGRKERPKHSSWGMKINQERFQIIERITGVPINISIHEQDLSTKKGTIVTLDIPKLDIRNGQFFN